MAAFVLTFLVVTLLAIPLLPAWREWAFPTDAEPLNVVRTQDANISHFAESFRQLLLRQIGDVVAVVEHDAQAVREGTLERGEGYVVMGETHSVPSFTGEETKSAEGHRVIVACGPLQLPDAYVMTREVYARQSVTVGPRTACRALLADGNAHFQWGSGLLRWGHAGDTLTADREARLWGRASAGRRIVLSPGTQFSRLNAPLIETSGHSADHEARGDDEPLELRPLERPQRLTFSHEGRWVIRHALDVPARSSHVGHLISTRDVRVGAASHLTGSIKSGRQMTIEAGVRIEGTVIARGKLTVGEDVVILGPLIGEDVIEIGPGTVVGTPDAPTTVTAPRIHLAPGVRVHGTVWAREEGRVLGTLTDSLMQLRV